MTTIVVPAAFLGVTSSDLVIETPTTVSPTPAGLPTRLEVRAVTGDGTVRRSFPEATVLGYQETLNGWEEVTFTIPLDVDADLATGAPGSPHLPLPNVDTAPERYVQIWRNGHLLFWGVPTGVRADSRARVWSYTARGYLWIFSKRNVGKARRTDILRGVGNFEGATLSSSWTPNGGDLTPTVETTIVLLDDQAARLTTDGSEDGGYLSYTFAQEAGAIGLALFLTGWVYVANRVQDRDDKVALWLGISPDEFFAADGLYRFISAQYGTSQQTVNGWIRLSVAASVLPNSVEYVQVRLYGLKEGDVIWDAVTVTALESFSMIGANSPGGAGWDQVSIAQELIKDLQGVSAFFSTTLGIHNGKSNLGVGTAGAASGIVKERTYQHADHPRGYAGGSGPGALDEFSKASDGFDYRIDVTPTTKTFRTYYPTVGTVWDLELVWVVTPEGDSILVESFGIVSWSYDASIVNAANNIVELGGWGSGAGREEGGYANPPSLGGLTLELVEGAPNGTPIDLLDAVAEQRGAQLEQAIITPTFVVAEPRDAAGNVTVPLIGAMRAGDYVPFRVREGSLILEGTYRLSKVAYDPTTETLALTPNPEPLGGGS